MKLGSFSVSLSVKDLQASKAFYEKLGFTVFVGDAVSVSLHHLFNIFYQRFDIVLYDIPNDFEINTEIFMDYPIPKPRILTQSI